MLATQFIDTATSTITVMEFNKIPYKSTFTEGRLISEWLACLHVYQIDPQALESSKSSKFIKINLNLVSETLNSKLSILNFKTQFDVIKLTTVDDFRYNMYLNIYYNVCRCARSRFFAVISFDLLLMQTD